MSVEVKILYVYNIYICIYPRILFSYAEPGARGTVVG
jgi:hypothetical protein